MKVKINIITTAIALSIALLLSLQMSFKGTAGTVAAGHYLSHLIVAAEGAIPPEGKGR